MPSIFYQKLRITIYSNDHPPPHAHVFGQNWEIKINLSNPPSLISILGKPKIDQVRKSLMGVYLNLDSLQKIWIKYHEQN